MNKTQQTFPEGVYTSPSVNIQTFVPEGVICDSIGGTTIEDWKPGDPMDNIDF